MCTEDANCGIKSSISIVVDDIRFKNILQTSEENEKEPSKKCDIKFVQIP